MRRAAKRDVVEAECVSVYRAAGWSWQPINQPGAPDGIVARGVAIYLVEHKSPGAAVTPAQARWRREWRGPVVVTVTCAREALALVSPGPSSAWEAAHEPSAPLPAGKDLNGNPP